MHVFAMLDPKPTYNLLNLEQKIKQNPSAITLNMHQKMYLKALVLYILTWITAAYQPQNFSEQKPNSGGGFGSSIVFPIFGNVHPTGCYNVTIIVGNPPKQYFLDIDTGSDLTWLQCDAPCMNCYKAPNSLYNPKGHLVTCQDPICISLGNHRCGLPDDQCDYEVKYADYGSSLGVLVRDSVPLILSNGTMVTPQLAFGCGYDQDVKDPPYVDGVLGLGKGEPSILNQLGNMGVTRNVVGHCLSGQGGGYLFFGDDFLPNSGIVWKPIWAESNHYSLGSADLKFDGKDTEINGLEIVLDSGSTYTYLHSFPFGALLSLISDNLDKNQLTIAPDDTTLPICWKGAQPFESIHDASSFFKPLALNFTDSGDIQFQLPPESYLIISDKGNFCLGILDGEEAGFEDFNVIGDISMQDKLVIYDNENSQVGWAATNCSTLPMF